MRNLARPCCFALLLLATSPARAEETPPGPDSDNACEQSQANFVQGVKLFKRDVGRQLDAFADPNYRTDSARLRLSTYALTADALRVASLIAEGLLSLYFTVMAHTDPAQAHAPGRALAAPTPTLGGMLFHGTW